jgi:hypothetical protein
LLSALCGLVSSDVDRACVPVRAAPLRGGAGPVAFQLFNNLRRAMREAVSDRLRNPPPLVDPTASDAPKYQQLASWAFARGIHFHRWQVGDVGGGLRGAIATKNIGEGCVLVSAPPAAVLSVQEADACPLPESFVQPEYWDRMAKKWEIRMALLLLYEMRLGEESAWAPYIEILPKEFGLPLTFSEEELEELQFPTYIADLRVEREYWDQQLQELAAVMPAPPSRQEMLWALSCASSRTFTCEFGGNLPPAQVMFPVADMFNHDSRASTAFRFRRGRFELTGSPKP